MMAWETCREFNPSCFLLQAGANLVLTTTVLSVLLSTRRIESGHRPAECGHMIANGTVKECRRMNEHMNKVARGGENGAGV